MCDSEKRVEGVGGGGGGRVGGHHQASSKNIVFNFQQQGIQNELSESSQID